LPNSTTCFAARPAKILKNSKGIEFFIETVEVTIEWDDLKEATYCIKDINKGPGIGIYTEDKWFTKENLS